MIDKRYDCQKMTDKRYDSQKMTDKRYDLQRVYTVLDCLVWLQ